MALDGEVVNVPLMGGQMEPPDQRYSRSMARTLFLRALRSTVPETLKDLHAQVFPVHKRIVVSSLHPDSSLVLRASPSSRPHLIPLAEALLPWAEGYHLTDHWMLDVALRTCESWAALTVGGEFVGADGQVQVLAEKDFFRWGPIDSHSHAMPLGTDLVTCVASGGRPIEIDLAFHTQAEEITRLMDAGVPRARAREKVKEVAEALKVLGWSPTPEKRDHDDDLLIHFEMLARYQCAAVSFRQLSTESESDWGQSRAKAGEFSHRRSSVIDAVKKTAAQVGLTLRPSDEN